VCECGGILGGGKSESEYFAKKFGKAISNPYSMENGVVQKSFH